MASLIHFVSFVRQKVPLSRTLIGISPTAPLTEDKFFQTFLTEASQNTIKREFSVLFQTFSLVQDVSIP